MLEGTREPNAVPEEIPGGPEPRGGSRTYTAREVRVTEDEQEHSEVGRYRIGSVSDLTGIPPHTLRAWERRYEAAVPVRTDAGFRLYSEDDVGRLSLIKRLSDLGHAIGSIANLGMKELQERLARAEERGWRSAAGRPFPADAPQSHHPHPLPLFLLEPSISAQILEAGGDSSGLHICASVQTPEALVESVRGREGTGVVAVVMGLRRLGPSPASVVRKFVEEPGVAAVVVVYDFAPRKVIRQLTLTGACLVQGAPGIDSLRRTIREVFESPASPRETSPAVTLNGNGVHPAVTNPRRLFTDAELGRLREVETAVDCECPNHMAQILSSLVAFEEYSRDCENRDAQDAELHAHLHRETGLARAIMERALLHLCQEEGIEL